MAQHDPLVRIDKKTVPLPPGDTIRGGSGDQGPQGVPGAKGDKGDTGAQGQQGNAGAQGNPGPKGDTGSQGNPGTQGIPGNAGSNGSNGTNGIDGKTLRNGSGAPANGLGVDGDFYIDPSAQLIYGPKAAGVWPGGVNYKGAQGIQGTQGQQGQQGTAGTNGTQGIQGVQGPAGPSVWGGITGTLSSQTDLQNALNAKQASLGFTAVPNTRNVAGKALSADITLAKADVGLGNVDNTADASKPVSSAQAAANAAVLAAIPNASYRTILDSSGSHTAAKVAGVYGMAQGDPLAVSGTGTLYPLNTIYIAAADYPNVDSKGPKLRIRAQVHCNDVAPTGNFTVGLHPITRPATSGGAGLCIYAIGAAVASVTVNTPAADSSNILASADFALPPDGHYVLAVTTTATVAASAHVHISASLQMRNN